MDDEDFDTFLERVMEEAGIDKSDLMDTAVNDKTDAGRSSDVMAEDHLPSWLADDEAPMSGVFDDDLLTSLSAELQTVRPCNRNLLSICAAMRHMHKNFRARIWARLLDFVDSDSIPEPDVEDEEHGFIDALAETSVLRINVVRNAYEIVDTHDEDANWGEMNFDEGSILTGLRETLRYLRCPATLCDPGLGDIMVVLTFPGLEMPLERIPQVIRMMQSKRIFLMHLPEESLIEIIKNRSKLLDLCLSLHDPVIGKCLLDIAPSYVAIPFRWWRCAFAGELPVPSILVLWDHLIIDSCPLNSGDDGPFSYSPLTG